MKYWAYLHKNGEIQVKSWYNGNTYIEDAEHSPFVYGMLGAPFEADDFDKAVEIATKKFSKTIKEWRKEGENGKS